MNCACGTTINPRRVALGYTTCLPCGDLAAMKEKEAKSRRVMPAYNKGGLTYMGSTEKAQREAAREMGRKNQPS